ncbi:MAG: alpha/beta fold hydrolase [Flavobacteriales bacterium]|nr:alpha/beta fold hydrolase [Flavobacteriales bacterium]
MKTLYSKIYGKGEPLLILHGLFGMGDNWITLAKQFANKYEVHIIDQRNHGRSFHDKSWTYQDMVSDLENYIDIHQLERVNLLGHSMGGKTVMCFASMHKKKMNKLIVADIAPKEYPVNHSLIIETLASLDFSKIHSRKQADLELAKSIDDFGIRQFLLKSLYWEDKGRLGFRFNIDVIIEKIKNVGVALPNNAYFDGPTLFLDGEKSNYISPQDEDDISLHFPDYRIEEIIGAGHWLHAEQPKIFYNLVSEFLEE